MGVAVSIFVALTRAFAAACINDADCLERDSGMSRGRCEFVGVFRMPIFGDCVDYVCVDDVCELIVPNRSCIDKTCQSLNAYVTRIWG